jgi:hypothetical protein
MFDEGIERHNAELMCIRCRLIFKEKELVVTSVMGGCIPVNIYHCVSCEKESKIEAKAQEYKEKHFCARCEEKFKRPYFKNRKHLSREYRWYRTSHTYCLECYEIVKVNLPKREEVQDLWGEFNEGDTESDKNGIW